MARKPKKQRRAQAQAAAARGTSDRDKAIDALMALLARAFLRADRAGRSRRPRRPEALATARRIRLDAGHRRRPHQGHRPRGARRRRRRHGEEPARERLFDVLMRRLEALAPYKEAVRSLMRSARRNPGLALALNAMAVRSQQWMLEAAGIGASGPHGALRAQGAALMFARVLSGLVRRRRARPRPHHGRARPRARQRRALGRLPRRPVLAAEMHLGAARAAAAVRATRKRSGSGVTLFRSFRATKSANPGPRTWVPAFAGIERVGCYTGTRTVARKPPSGLSPSVMSPPCERAMSRAIASPRPVPPSS